MAYNSIPPAGFPKAPSVSEVDDLRAAVSALQSALTTINETLDDLEERVEALEGGD